MISLWHTGRHTLCRAQEPWWPLAHSTAAACSFAAITATNPHKQVRPHMQDTLSRPLLCCRLLLPPSSGSPLVVIKRLERFKLAALLAEAGQLAVDVQAEAPHVLLTHAEALVVRFLVCQEPLAALHLRCAAGGGAAGWTP